MIYAWIIYIIELITSILIGPPVVRATLDGSHAYTSGVNGRSTGVYSVSGGGVLSILRQDIRRGEKPTILDHQNGIRGGSTALLRWQLIDKTYHCVLYHFASDETICRTSAALGSVPLAAIEKVNGIDKLPDFRERHDQYRKASDSWPFLGTRMSANGWQPDAIKERIFFDIWARGSKLWEVYVTEPHKGNRLTREDFHPERVNRGVEQEKLIWEMVGEWTYDWAGPFYVAASGDDRYFITETGRVFVAPRGAKAGAPLKEIWKDKPVDALIHDADNGKWYAFTKDQYFEVADPVKPKAHTIAIRRSKTADEALEVAAKCGRVIRGLPEPKAK